MLKFSLESFIARIIAAILCLLLVFVYVLGKDNSLSLNNQTAVLNTLLVLIGYEILSLIFTNLLNYFSRKKAETLIDSHDTVLGKAKEIKE